MEKNTELVKEVQGTPYRKIKTEQGETLVLVGRTLIAKYVTEQEADIDIEELCQNKLLLATIFEMARIVHEKYDEIYADRELQKQ